MIHESPNWRVVRRIGIGDREHARSNLLSIGCFSTRHLTVSVEAAFRAGAELGMQPTRVHINTGREHPIIREQLERITLRFMQFDAQLMEHGHFIMRHRFDEMFESCDMLVSPKGEPNLNVDTYLNEAVSLIKSCWRDNSGRFLNGNFARWSAAELRERYPDMWPSSDPFYYEYTHANPL